MNAVNGKLGPIRSELFHICRKDNLRSIVLRSLLILSIIDSVMFKTKTNTDWESLMIKTTYYLHHQNQCRSKCLMGKKTRPLLKVLTTVCALFFKTYFLFAGGCWSERLESEEVWSGASERSNQKKMMMRRWQILHDKKEENFAFS